MSQFKILVIFYLLSDVTLQQEVNSNYVFSEIPYRIKVLRFLCDNKTFEIPLKLKEKSKCIPNSLENCVSVASPTQMDMSLPRTSWIQYR